MDIKYCETASLIPYAKNSRTHSDAQIAQIAGSIREFGFTNPVLLDNDNGIIAGHGRVLAALKLGMDKVPCIELSHMTEMQKRAYIIADNRLAELAAWDTSMLEVEIADLKLGGFDLDLIGFSLGDLDGMFGGQHGTGDTDPQIDRAQEFQGNDDQRGNTKEINPDDFEMASKCPRCGFVFNEQS